MSRIKSRFKQLQEQGRVALVPFVTAGDPNPDVTVPLMHAMVGAGADIIELGVPFSDPMADGPVIQRASERALEHNVGMRDVLEMVSEFRKDDSQTPVVLMGYLNPIEVMGYGRFAEEAGAAGVDGVLTVDLPPEEAEGLLQALRPRDIDPIFLMAPTSTPERIRQICNAASGFVYYVSVKGITGASHLAIDEVSEKVAGIRDATDLPVGVGFGIKDADSARAVARVADAVVVGSAIVGRIEKLVDQPDAVAPELTGFLSTLRQAIDNK
jgi:tryptophan synthase alpha chain